MHIKRITVTTVTVLAALLLILIGFTASAVMTENRVSAAQAVQVKLVLSRTELTLGKGESYTLSATLSKGDSVRKWVSSDTSVLTIKDGVITTKKTGEATITARTVSNQAATCHVKVMQAPKTCTLNVNELTLGVGEDFRFYCSVPSGTAACVRDYTVSNKSVLSYSSGTVRGLKAGTATVTVRLFNGVTASCKVTVKNAPKTCTLSAKELTIGAGESYRFTCDVPGGTASRVRTYSVKDKNVLSLDGSTVNGLKAGTTTVTVKLFNGVTDTCRVTVKKAPSTCTLSAKTLTLGVGESFRFSCNIPSDTAARVRTYTVDNDHFVTCDGKGTITGRKPGTTTVRVTLFNGVTDTCNVTVKKAPTTASLSASSLTMGVGESYQFSCNIPTGTAARVRTYSSNNSSVVSCSATGKIQAQKTGTATITVRLFNGVTASCKVTVKNAPSSVSMNYSSIYLGVGESTKIQPVLPDNTASYVRRYSVSDTSVISCDNSGNVTAKKQGTAKVTVRLFNGVSASCTVEVSAVAPSIEVQNDLAVLDIGETFRIVPLTENGAEYSNITYSSGNTSVATVDKNGVIRAKGSGTTDITLKTSGGKKAKVAVIVWGDKSSSYFPNADEVDALLDQVKLSAPMKTNCRTLDDLVGSILSGITRSNMTTSQKVRACYDYLAQNCTYGYGYIPVDLPGEYDYYSDYFIVTMAYPILKNHVGTCENFAAAFTVLMRRIGMEANVVEGLVGMRAGGKGGHYWTDLSVCGRHLVFDTQVENNNLGSGGYVYHYWYGMAPEYNYRSYEYEALLPAKGFIFK